MEWTKQTEEMVKSWTEAQTKMWNDWLKGMQGFARSQPSQVWGKTVEAWDESVRKALDTQVEWTQRWAENFTTGKGAPKEMVDWAKQGQEMIRRWADTQKQLWASWFEIVKKLEPSSAPGVDWSREGQKLVQGWQEAIQKALDTQAEYVRLWTAGQGGKKPKGQD
ncbi:MAG: hypothetical protein ACREQA_04940 [Candidatus Binatia bacterium]